jgi:hypothetical protein
VQPISRAISLCRYQVSLRDHLPLRHQLAELRLALRPRHHTVEVLLGYRGSPDGLLATEFPVDLGCADDTDVEHVYPAP